MRPAKSTGRTVGTLLVLQLAGLIVPFILLMPITTSTFLADAAGSSVQIRLAVMLLFANAALTIGIAIAAFPTLREHSYGWALSLLAVSVVWFTIQAVDNAQILSMLSLSQQYAARGAANPQFYDVLGMALRSTRRWVHYTELLVVDAWLFLFYLALLRFGLVPRALSAFGLTMVVVHAVAIPIPVFLAYPSVQILGISLALSHLGVGAWLVVRGFGEFGEHRHLSRPAANERALARSA